MRERERVCRENSVVARIADIWCRAKAIDIGAARVIGDDQMCKEAAVGELASRGDL